MPYIFLFPHPHRSLQIFPDLYNWVTYGICNLLSNIRDFVKQDIDANQAISPYLVEFASSLERAYNFGHTGNSRVLSRKLMDQLWLSLGITNNGFPSLHPALEWLTQAQLPEDTIDILQNYWPVDTLALGERPMMASQRAQILTYGEHHWQVRDPKAKMIRDPLLIRVHDIGLSKSILAENLYAQAATVAVTRSGATTEQSDDAGTCYCSDVDENLRC